MVGPRENGRRVCYDEAGSFLAAKAETSHTSPPSAVPRPWSVVLGLAKLAGATVPVRAYEPGHGWPLLAVPLFELDLGDADEP